MNQLSGFYVPWLAAVSVSAGEPSPIGATVIHFEGMDLPLVQLVLAAAGVLMARPLARKKEAKLPLSHFLIVTAIMVVLAVAWVAQSRPGVLFTFVVAIGLGFSGYSLVETAGQQIQDFIKRIFATATDAIGSIGGKK